MFENLRADYRELVINRLWKINLVYLNCNKQRFGLQLNFVVFNSGFN
jgi:hypothetical protein